MRGATTAGGSGLSLPCTPRTILFTHPLGLKGRLMLYSNRTRIEARQCEAVGCTWAAATRLPMCLGHWHKVPGDAQGDIWKAYRSMPTKTPVRKELMESLPFVLAMARAVELVAESEGRPAANPFRHAVEAVQQQSESFPLAA